MNRKYMLYDNSEMLKNRFENGFPLLYPMDKVEICFRLAEKGGNPLDGKRAYVHTISHSLQSRYKRNYLIVGLLDKRSGNTHDFKSLLSTLDLVEKDKSTGIADTVLDQFGCLLYIDDRIRVKNHPVHKGKIGNIIFLQGPDVKEGLGLAVEDESVSEELNKLYDDLAKKVEYEFMNQYNGKFTYEDELQEKYEMELKNEIFKKMAADLMFEQKLAELKAEFIFIVSSKDVELIERFPPNDLFSID